MTRALTVIFAPGLAFLLLMWIAVPASRTNAAIYVVVGLSTLAWALCVGIYAAIAKYLQKKKK